jgi:DDE superfamily endonuclease
MVFPAKNQQLFPEKPIRNNSKPGWLNMKNFDKVFPTMKPFVLLMVHTLHTNVQPACGWIKKGVCKEIPSNTGRKRLNLSGAIDVIAHKIVIHEDKTLNAEAAIRFFQKIEKAYPNKTIVHVFCDNAPCCRNKTVKQYLETSKISLHFLPPCSPNLNPIEQL